MVERTPLKIGFLLALLVLTLSAIMPAQAGTLDDVKARGHLICGVSEGLPGFSAKDAQGVWRGFDADICRAVAAAIFNDVAKIRFVPLSADARFEALTKARIDILSRNTTWTMARDIELGISFPAIVYHDGQGFLVRVSDGISSALQLSGARLCVLKSTTSQVNAERYFKTHKINTRIIAFDTREAALKAYEEAQCDSYSADSSALAAVRVKLKNKDAHVILPEIISKEPLSPAVRGDDRAWFALVRWVIYALINAEEDGLTQARPGDGAPGAKFAKSLGLNSGWLRDMLKATGNYAEIFDRNIGKDTELELNRGVNALWTRGGILYAPPMR